MGLKDSGRCLERLSEDPMIGEFRNVFLVYSYDDGYSPAYSSKVIVSGANALQRQMCRNFWSRVKVGRGSDCRPETSRASGTTSPT